MNFNRSGMSGELVGGKYLLGRVIGSGGMGVVYEATHKELRTACAVKVVDPKRGDPAQSKRLLREARVLAELSGPYAVRVLDAGRLASGSPYLVMERLSGVALSDRLKQGGPLGREQAVEFAWQICAAVREAHARGIIHRDLKPSNVFVLAEDRIKVLDFGLATRIGAAVDDSLVTASEFAGSPRYMSPEQIRASSSITPSTDIWSLGVVLFEMLAGRAPFEGPNTAAVLASIVADPAARLREFVPDIPLELDRLIADCLEKHPPDRPSDIVQVQARLEALRSSWGAPVAVVRRVEPSPGFEAAAEPTLSGPVFPASPARSRANARGRNLVLGTAALVLVAVAAFSMRWRAQPPSPVRASEALVAANPPVLEKEAPEPVAAVRAPPDEAPPPKSQPPRSVSRPVRRPAPEAIPSASGGTVLDAISTRH